MKSAKKTRFCNTHVKSSMRSFGHFFLWFIRYYRKKNSSPIPIDFTYPDFENPKTESTVTWINHATFLIKTAELNFITDPIFSKRCSPVSFCGPKRQHSPYPNLSTLPKIDFILISHNHYDHLDLHAIKWILQHSPNAIIVVPEKLKDWFLKKKIVAANSIIELCWFQKKEFFNYKLSITSVPAQHFSGRGVFDKNKTHWMGVVVEIENRRFYFAGDTGYNDYQFRQIKHKLGKMDLSLIPIGAYEPREFMQAVHINPEEAVQIHQDVDSQLSVAGHWCTFRLSEEEIYRPPYDLYKALTKKNIPLQKFRVLHPGQKIYW